MKAKSRMPADVLPRLMAGEGIGRGLARVAAECCERAAGFRGNAPDAAAVHTARRALKRARAVLRLGEGLDVGGARAARRRLAARGRELSERRDAAVVRKVAARLAGEAQREAEREALRVLVERASERAKQRARWAAWKARVTGEAMRIRKEDWGRPTLAEVRQVLEQGARRVTRRAKTARAGGDLAAVHEWRKAAIVLREQVRVLRVSLGGEAGEIAERLEALAHRLGKALDYRVFLATAKRVALPRRLGRIGKRRKRRQLKKAWKRWPKTRRALRGLAE